MSTISEKMRSQALGALLMSSGLGLLGTLGLRKIAKLEASFSKPLATALVGSAISLPLLYGIEKSSIDLNCKNGRFNYAGIGLMALIFFGAYRFTPRLSKLSFTRSESITYSSAAAIGAIFAYLKSSKPKTT